MSRKVTHNIIILLLSILIPASVAFLLFMPEKMSPIGDWYLLLPHINAIINTLTCFVLISGFILIRNKHVELHKMTMSTALVLGVLFLAFYLIYHSTSESTVYGDINGNGLLDMNERELIGSTRMIYLFVLLSHILLAVIVVPFVLFAFYFALSDKIEKHKKTVRYTLPIWLYVSVSGIVVYLMIRPYY